ARGGDAIVMNGFDEEQGRSALYAAYQRYFDLRPRRYEELDRSVQALLRLPFVMALLAQTYGRRPDDAAGGAAPGMIPRSLDYLQLFGLLTARKASDAQRLLAPTDP